MKNAAFSIEELFRFLDAGVSAFHSTAAAAAILEAEGYVNCPESAAWELAPGGKYYTTRNGSAVLAWRMPKGELTGWHAAASHSDSPTWRIKQFDTEDKVFAKAEVEGYGGMIMPSWLDRPLTVAGRLLVRTESGIESRLVCPDRALACIPNLCIHFSRDLNNGMKYNPQVDLQPIFGGKGGNLKEVLAAEAGVKAEDILDADLVLATREKAVRMGLNGEYFMSGRIDDLECAYTDQLEEDLGWLGLFWDEGGSKGGPHEPYYQSECSGIYAESYKKLEAMGLVYPCFCSRSQLHAASAPHTSDGNVIYPGTCRGLTAEEIAEKRKKKAPAYRLMVPDENITFTDGCMGEHTENLLRDCGDFYLRRADGVFAYQLAVVVDDARMGVTEVVRGADLLSSTARQLYLYRLLGLPAPKFAHCPLLLASDGRRLSKRDGDQSLENLRARYTAEDIVGRLAYAYGLQEEPAPRTPESLIKDFSWDKVPKKDICLPEGLFE